MNKKGISSYVELDGSERDTPESLAAFESGFLGMQTATSAPGLSGVYK